MITVGQLAQQLQQLDLQKNVAGLSFYQYFKNSFNADTPFIAEHIDMFYDRALAQDYWLVNKNQLGAAIRAVLQTLASKQPVGFDLSQTVHSDDLQIVLVEQARDFAALLSRDVKKMEKAGEKIKTFRLHSERQNTAQNVLFVRLQKDASLVVEVRQNIAVIVEGELQLIRPHTRLVYDADLEFEVGVEQSVHTSRVRLARFTASHHEPAKLRGHFMQAPHFHCTETFDRTLIETPELFHAIKRLERYFVNPITDPYYQQMIDSFEQGQYENNV